MFRLLRAALLGFMIAIFALWFIYPGAFMSKVYSFLHQYEVYPNQELKERILAERALSAPRPKSAQPTQEITNPRIKKPEPQKLIPGTLVFTEEVLPFQYDQLSLQFEKNLYAVDNKSNALWLGFDDDNLSKLQWWHPASSRLRTFELPNRPLSFRDPPLTVAMPSGLLIVGGIYAPYKHWFNDLTRLVFIDPDGHLAMANLNVRRENPELLVLDDGSVLVFGGDEVEVNTDPRQRGAHATRIGKSIAIERIRYIDNQLQIELLADLPGEPRRGMEMVELDNDRVMVVGGSTAKYTGGKPMSAETYIMDLKENRWLPGPLLNTPRSAPAIHRLPDGKVLVSGGWTPELDWTKGPGTSTELFEPENNRFVAGRNLPLPLSGHRTLWAPGQHGKQLLLLGGVVGPNDGNDQVLALDLGSGLWHNVAQNCKDYHGKKSRVKVAAIQHEDVPYLLCFKTETPMERAWSSNRLRLPNVAGTGQLALDENDYGINLHRTGMAFFQPEDNLPGLAAGGLVNGAQSAAADAILPDGRIISLAPLNHRRAGSQAFRLNANAWLVVGGIQGVMGSRRLKYPPPELLIISGGLEHARWSEVNLQFQKGAILSHLKDDDFVSINPDGSVERISLEIDLQNKLRVAKRSTLASLNRARNQDFGEITVRNVDDGRIIVAGGGIQQYRVALLDENTINGTEPDRYQSFGHFEPARHYDIYNPGTNSWQISTPMENQGHRYAILPDGRVAAWSMHELLPNPSTPNGTAAETKAMLEISSSDGKNWRPLDGSAPHIMVNYPTGLDDLYSMDGELFITGTMPKSPSHRKLDALEWFNADSQSWELLWQSTEKDSLLDHRGHIIKRTLTNGKKVVLPVEAP